MQKEGRKKEASKVTYTTKQSNTAHPRQSQFQRKMSCLGWDSNPQHSTMCIVHIDLLTCEKMGLINPGGRVGRVGSG